MAALAANFIAAADEVGHLQRGEDDECRLFQKIAEQGHYAGRTVPTDTRQGTYATTASGVLLASINTNSSLAMAEMLRRALGRWRELDPAARSPVRTMPARVDRFEARYPSDGLVLKVFTRDLPRDPPGDQRMAPRWNQDFAWFTRSEARSLLPDDLEVGMGKDVPQALVTRLARLHLIDNVRGQTPPMPPASVKLARIATRITAISGSSVQVIVEGDTRTEETGHWRVFDHQRRGDDHADPDDSQSRGFSAHLVGRATYDRERDRFSAFTMVAAGSRWGGTQFNSRGRDLDPAPMGVALVLAGDTPAERVAPACWWEYGW